MNLGNAGVNFLKYSAHREKPSVQAAWVEQNAIVKRKFH